MNSSFSSLIKKLLLLVGFVVLAYAIYYVIEHWQNLGNVTITDPQLLLFNIPLLMINLYASGRLLDTTLSSLGISLSASESFGLAALSRFGNYLSFGQVGFAIRMYYLKKIHQVSVSHSLSGIALGNVLFYLITASTGVVALLSLGPGQETGSSIRYLALFVFIILIFLFLPILAKGESLQNSSNPLFTLIREYNQLVIMFWSSLSDASRLLFWALTLLLSFAAMQAVEFYALGYQANAIQVLIITCATSFTSLINITPAGLGVTEGLLFVSGELTNVPDNVLIASALIRRAIVLTVVTLVAAVYAHRLFNQSLRNFWTNFRSES